MWKLGDLRCLRKFSGRDHVVPICVHFVEGFQNFAFIEGCFSSRTKYAHQIDSTFPVLFRQSIVVFTMTEHFIVPLLEVEFSFLMYVVGLGLKVKL